MPKDSLLECVELGLQSRTDRLQSSCLVLRISKGLASSDEMVIFRTTSLRLQSELGHIIFSRPPASPAWMIVVSSPFSLASSAFSLSLPRSPPL